MNYEVSYYVDKEKISPEDTLLLRCKFKNDTEAVIKTEERISLFNKVRKGRPFVAYSIFRKLPNGKGYKTIIRRTCLQNK